MKTTLANLERAVPIMLTLDRNGTGSVQWEGFLDAEAMRVRRFMQQSFKLTKTAHDLQTTQCQIQRLLTEHRVASRVLTGSLCSTPMGGWRADVQRWRQLARKHFTPWTMEACEIEIDDALKELNALLWSSGMQSTGVSFLGWRERRRINCAGRALQFVFHKDSTAST